MEQHSGTNSFGKCDNNDSPKREEYRLRPQREMAQDHQDSNAPRYNRNQPRRKVDSYRPGRPHQPRVPRRNCVAKNSTRPGPSTHDTTTQDSQTSPFEIARTSLNRAAGSANTSEELESAPLVSHPAEFVPSTEEKETPSSRDEDEYELLCEHAGGPLRRFTKKMCDVITETITENCHDDTMSAIDILKQACINLSVKTGTTLEVHDCWLYWRKRGMKTNIARWWPDSLDDIDREVADYRRLRSAKSDRARAAYAARLATVPVASVTTEAFASPDPVEESNDWPREEKLLLFAKLKGKRPIQHRLHANMLWIMVGHAMRRDGYTRGRDEYREWFEKYGRAYFGYDETRYYSRPGNSHVGTGRMENGIMTPEDSPVGDARRRRRRNSHTDGGRARLHSNMTPISPSVPKTPKPNKPRTSTTVLHDIKSWLGGYRNIDKTAKVAEEYPLPLIKPSEGERFEPFTTESQETYDPPPPAAASPPGSPLFITEDEPQTERNIVPLALDSTNSHSSPAPAVTDAPSTMPDETGTPEERVESIGEIEAGETMTPGEKIESGETMPEDENDTPSLQPNEIDNTQDGVQWTAEQWGFATPPFMRPSEPDIAWIDEYIDFESSHISATTDSSDPSTSATHPSFDDSLTSNETIEEVPLSQPSATSDDESKNNTSSESQAQLLREQQERTDIEISNLQANYLRVKEAEDDEEKKLDDTAQELDIMILRRAEQLKTQTAHLAEMQRIEAELEEKKKVKQALSIALEELELFG
ncbi:hypothetical protein BOTCAL_0042g00210 [Botryotinia calthae]|uniref:Uncharacterized protein n=1 Tax=Botryotinia calthae TaxID=38488 RepID=A0A4Y8DBV7_9HELO|nr:hypothetical protein BOTCAL_0042g00210 [Botryotinia calthae]